MISHAAAEFLGTLILILLGCGVNAGATLKNSYSQGAGWIVISIAWGLAVTFAIYAVGSISGAHINPAVTLALAAGGEFAWAEVPWYIAGQMGGAIVGATLVWLHYLPHWKATEDPAAKLGVFSTSPAMPSRWANVLSEVLGTFALLFGLLAIGANKFTEGLNPAIVGLLIVVIGMSMGGTTGYAINPARDLGPRIAHFILPIAGKGDSNWRYAWVPVVGPIFGGVYGTLVFQLIFKSQAGPEFWIFSAAMAALLGLAVWEGMKAVGREK